MKCSSVQILGHGISQLDGDRLVATIPRDAIVRIKLSHDSLSRHPFLQFFTGFVLIACGLILSIAAFLIDEAGIYLVRLQSRTFGIPVVPIGLVLIIWLGGWFLIGVFRGRYNFLIHTEKGARKIFFEESADIREIRRFIRRAVVEFGYEIDVSLMKTMYFQDDPADGHTDDMSPPA